MEECVKLILIGMANLLILGFGAVNDGVEYFGKRLYVRYILRNKSIVLIECCGCNKLLLGKNFNNNF